MSGRGKEDNAVALAASLGLRWEDATVKGFKDRGDVALSDLCNDDAHKEAALASRTQLQKWLSQRIKSHLLVWSL